MRDRSWRAVGVVAASLMFVCAPSASAVSLPSFQIVPNPTCPASPDANSLNKVGRACVDESGMINGTSEWNSIGDGSVHWDAPNAGSPYASGNYQWDLPSSIPTTTGPNGGNNMGVTVNVQAQTAYTCASMSVSGDFTASPPPNYQVCADPGKQGSLAITVRLQASLASGTAWLRIGTEDGPSFYYEYFYGTPTPPPPKKPHTKISYTLVGAYRQPTRTTPFSSVLFNGTGSFDFAGSPRTSRATGENNAGKMVLTARRGTGGPDITAQLKPVATYYFRTVEADRTIVYRLRVVYQVISSALPCLPVGSQLVFVGQHHVGHPDLASFGSFCGANDTSYSYQRGALRLQQSQQNS